ncbi:hypothetical protein GQ602_003425 [Ophiocordyceps camponoti-floridani]|uniref:Uncharacterized protein n=1 Tax=Ophiocordyceps camponoti-floridani TaxID=2030778 RepID=A0A8H4Q838_9HYPO|nr:hypothetical protein GQ602_003425 [Ophiocordyceps camponoti-floridani]
MSVRCLSHLLALIFLLVIVSSEVGAIPPARDQRQSRPPGDLMSWIMQSLGFAPQSTSPPPYNDLGPPLPPPPQDLVRPSRPPQYFGNDPNELHDPPPPYSPEPLDDHHLRESSPPPRYSRDPPDSQSPSPLPPKRNFEGSSMELVGEDGRDEDGNLLYENLLTGPRRPSSEDHDVESMDDDYLNMDFDESLFEYWPSMEATSSNPEQLYDDAQSPRTVTQGASFGANNAHGSPQDSHYDDVGDGRASEPLYADVGNGLASTQDSEYADADFAGSDWEPYHGAGSSQYPGYDEAVHDELAREPIYHTIDAENDVDTDDEPYANAWDAQDLEEESLYAKVGSGRAANQGSYAGGRHAQASVPKHDYAKGGNAGGSAKDSNGVDGTTARGYSHYADAGNARESVQGDDQAGPSRGYSKEPYHADADNSRRLTQKHESNYADADNSGRWAQENIYADADNPPQHPPHENDHNYAGPPGLAHEHNLVDEDNDDIRLAPETAPAPAREPLYIDMERAVENGYVDADTLGNAADRTENHYVEAGEAPRVAQEDDYVDVEDRDSASQASANRPQEDAYADAAHRGPALEKSSAHRPNDLYSDAGHPKASYLDTAVSQPGAHTYDEPGPSTGSEDHAYEVINHPDDARAVIMPINMEKVIMPINMEKVIMPINMEKTKVRQDH